jgi:hypothetical protein
MGFGAFNLMNQLAFSASMAGIADEVNKLDKKASVPGPSPSADVFALHADASPTFGFTEPGNIPNKPA